MQKLLRFHHFVLSVKSDVKIFFDRCMAVGFVR